jgi:hypothetical protein
LFLNIPIFLSLGFNAQDFVAGLHEGEQVYLAGDDRLLCFGEVELRVRQSFKRYEKVMMLPTYPRGIGP